MNEERKERCLQRHPDPKSWSVCSLLKGHTGSHLARDAWGGILAVWRQGVREDVYDPRD